MNFDLIKQKLREQNLKQKELAEKLNLGESAISSWKRGIYPQVQTLIEMCEILDMSADELLGINSKPKAGEPEQITEDGKRLLKYYMNCSVEGRAAIMKTAEAMESLNSSKETSYNSEILMNERNAV